MSKKVSECFTPAFIQQLFMCLKQLSLASVNYVHDSKVAKTIKWFHLGGIQLKVSNPNDTIRFFNMNKKSDHLGIPGLKNIESPKSSVLSGDSSSWLMNRKFSGFRSRCITPREWHASTTPTIILASAAAFLSV